MVMKTLFAAAAALFILSITAFRCADSSAKKNDIVNAGNGFAVVELFTSEGCSSCPPADAVVANLLKEYKSDVYVLGYHVDYWDNLGWKDVFSNAAYTKRQRNYAKSFKLSSVYTPQVIVNGEEQFVGSDENKLHASINKDLKQIPAQTLSVTAKANTNNTVNVSYQTNATNTNLNVALIQLSAETKVQRGENHGATLHHVNIVRNIETVSPKNNTGNILLDLPAGLSAKDCQVIVFTQNTNMKITAAAKTNIQL
jgi:hypothetical protein